MPTRQLRALLTAALAAPLLLAGCGEATGGAAVTDVFRDVEYYGACGNEVLEHAGLTFYPLTEEEVADLGLSGYNPGSAAAGQPVILAAGPGLTAGGGDLGGPAALPAVQAPGPGDDTGTLTVFEDGIAHFVSDSEDIELWLTDEPRDYNWVC